MKQQCYHSSQAQYGPFGAERRLVYLGNPFKAIGEGINWLWEATPTRYVRGTVGVIFTPITAPTRFTWGMLKNGWKVGVVGGANVVDVGAGSVVEATKGVKDMTVNPLWALASAGINDVKLNAVNLPLYVGRNAPIFGYNMMRAPDRTLTGSFAAINETRKKMWEFTKNRWQNGKEIVSNAAKIHFIEATKSVIKSVRAAATEALAAGDAIAAKLFQGITPLLAIEGGMGGAAKIIYESKKGYWDGIMDFYKKFGEGAKRLIKAPGHRLNWPPLNLLMGKATNGAAAAGHGAHPEPPTPAPAPTPRPAPTPAPPPPPAGNGHGGGHAPAPTPPPAGGGHAPAPTPAPGGGHGHP